MTRKGDRKIIFKFWTWKEGNRKNFVERGVLGTIFIPFRHRPTIYSMGLGSFTWWFCNVLRASVSIHARLPGLPTLSRDVTRGPLSANGRPATTCHITDCVIWSGIVSRSFLTARARIFSATNWDIRKSYLEGERTILQHSTLSL